MKPVIFFDGECSICNASVRYIYDHDPLAYFLFSSQQSALGQRVIDRYGPVGDTLFVVEEGKMYTQSAAVVRIARRLRFWHKLCAVFALAVPRPVLDSIYDWVARNRHSFSSTKPLCHLPSPAFQSRIIGPTSSR